MARLSMYAGFLMISMIFSQNGLAADKLLTFVSILPQKYFVQQIGKDFVDVQVMVQPGASPHTYEPRPRQMADLSKAKAYFAVGVTFEDAWLNRIAAANPKMKVVHTDHGIKKLPMAPHPHHDDKDAEHQYKGAPEEGERHHAEDEHHEADEPGHGHHGHGGLDPHIWLSPPLVKIQARNILTALQEIDPAHRAFYETNFQKFVLQIDGLDVELNKIFAGRQGLQFMVFHPAWGYFAHAYGLTQVCVEIEGKDPKPAQLKTLIEHAREKGIKVIFVQPQFSIRNAEIVAREIGGQVAFADPLAEDWMANLREVAENFKAALK